MDIRLSVFPTDKYPKMIAYTNNYKIRPKLANQLFVLLNKSSQVSDRDFPYQIIIENHTRYLPYDRGRAIEIILDYISHREENRIYGE